MREFGAAGADQADEAQDLAGAQVQIDVLVLALACQAGGFDDDRRIADVAGGDGLVEPLARHQFRQPRLGHAGGVEYANQSTIAQDGDAARHVEHLCQPMAHENYGDAGGGKRAHHGEQVVRLGLCERGGGPSMKTSFASLASARAIATNCLPEMGKLFSGELRSSSTPSLASTARAISRMAR